jgi:hypothetical protein
MQIWNVLLDVFEWSALNCGMVIGVLIVFLAVWALGVTVARRRYDVMLARLGWSDEEIQAIYNLEFDEIVHYRTGAWDEAVRLGERESLSKVRWFGQGSTDDEA